QCLAPQAVEPRPGGGRTVHPNRARTWVQVGAAMKPWNRLSLRIQLTLFSLVFLAVLITLYAGLEFLFSAFGLLPELTGLLVSLLVVMTGMVLSAQWIAYMVLEAVKRMSETAAEITA